jgi:hypothetical protein
MADDTSMSTWMVLLLKNLLFTVLVPGTVAVHVPRVLAGAAARATGALLGREARP